MKLKWVTVLRGNTKIAMARMTAVSSTLLTIKKVKVTWPDTDQLFLEDSDHYGYRRFNFIDPINFNFERM